MVPIYSLSSELLENNLNDTILQAAFVIYLDYRPRNCNSRGICCDTMQTAKLLTARGRTFASGVRGAHTQAAGQVYLWVRSLPQYCKGMTSIA
jgi:hypothetical protein